MFPLMTAPVFGGQEACRINDAIRAYRRETEFGCLNEVAKACRVILQGKDQQMNSAAHRAISVVIVTYQSAQVIDRCLAPLCAAPSTPIEIVLLDNASSDGTLDQVKSRYPEVHAIANRENSGFSKGNNLAISASSGRYVLLLNPDAFLPSLEAVFSLADYLEAHSDVAAIGPRVIDPDGTHQIGDAGWRVSFSNVLCYSFLLHRVCARFPSIFLANPRLLQTAAVEVDWIGGACLMVRREVIEKIGGLAERFFMYGEDLEWGQRMRDGGYKVVYLPHIKVVHLRGHSQRKSIDPFFSTKWLDAIIRLFAESHSRPACWAVRLMLASGLLLRAFLLGISGMVTGRSTLLKRARFMWRYSLYALRLT
jgi:N-acetylglucosaminyl-diphospho-decaprenol L-rhamnosyltransferase